MLLPGDPAPDFTVASNVNPRFSFNTAAGRYVVISFFGSSQNPFSARMLQEVVSRREKFDVTNLIFLGVSIDPNDVQVLKSDDPGILLFWDLDLAVSRQFDAVPADSTASQPSAGEVEYRPRTLVLDEAMRVVAIVPQSGDPLAHVNEVFAVVNRLPKIETLQVPAPVIVLPNVFERGLCQTLIEYYKQNGGEDSGFMRDVNGKTMPVYDYSHKRRADCEIKDAGLIQQAQARLKRRVVPAIKQAFQFNATRIERHIVACYDAQDGGHFKSHRDNTTLGTAHRRFAVTMNLNADDFDGGELWFPEFGRRKYKAPTGGAIVFSCSLLHEASKVTRGRRYAFLPFLYDDAAAKVRERNFQFVSSGTANNAPAANAQ